MGLFDRWRDKGKPSSAEEEGFEALIAEMTVGGAAVIVTRDDGTYTVYWVRSSSNESPTVLGTTVDALKRSSEGHGEIAVAKTTVKTTTTTETETRTQAPDGTTIKVEVQPPAQSTEQTPPPTP